jgi:hypothetical protein
MNLLWSVETKRKRKRTWSRKEFCERYGRSHLW